MILQTSLGSISHSAANSILEAISRLISRVTSATSSNSISWHSRQMLNHQQFLLSQHTLYEALPCLNSSWQNREQYPSLSKISHCTFGKFSNIALQSKLR